MSERAQGLGEGQTGRGSGEVVTWSLLLLAVGLAMLALGPAVSILWIIWGLLLLGVGALVHRVRQLPMLLVAGVVLMWAGVSNLLSLDGPWRFTGTLPLALGLAMAWRFRQLGHRADAAVPLLLSVGCSPVDTRPSSRLLKTFPLLSYGMGIAALVALPVVFVVGLSTTKGNPAAAPTLAALLAVDTAIAALGLALGSAALSHYSQRRPLAIEGMIGSGVVLLAFIVLFVACLVDPS